MGRKPAAAELEVQRARCEDFLEAHFPRRKILLSRVLGQSFERFAVRPNAEGVRIHLQRLR